MRWGLFLSEEGYRGEHFLRSRVEPSDGEAMEPVLETYAEADTEHIVGHLVMRKGFPIEKGLEALESQEALSHLTTLPGPYIVD